MSKDFTHIDRYLDGEMDAEEIGSFEAAMAADANLAAEVKLQEEMRRLYSDKEWIDGSTASSGNAEVEKYAEFFRSKEADNLRNTIKNTIREEKSRKNNTSKYIGIAASVLLFFGLSVFFFWNRTPDYESLYVKYLDKDNITSVVSRGADENALVQGQLLFEEGNYKEAISALSQYQKETERVHPTSYIYLGVSYLESDQYKNALDTFERLRTSNTLESAKANWYSAMVYLKQQDIPQLTRVLREITTSKEHYNFKEAKTLLNAIK